MWWHTLPPRGSPPAFPRCTERVSGGKGSGRLTCHFGSGLCQGVQGGHVRPLRPLPGRQPTLHMDERRVTLLLLLDLGWREGKATGLPVNGSQSGHHQGQLGSCLLQ
ncbi:hypothetical protein AAFF_G00127770 [Aldrovandia affinis]|uniref:Uncharacterized protein n=1 Tax=Aldrovandia affinis TaxID=143900 RepID=A0AAD7T133_9TELE|nr:hypothetical protein AAFF_G00127770 [Aldrovandia affinis]